MPRGTFSKPRREPGYSVYFIQLPFSKWTRRRRSRTMLGALLQIVVATLACLLVGYLWYSPALFGRLWWSFQFPGRQFGDWDHSSDFPLYLTALSMLVQNAIFTCILNNLLPLIEPVTPVGFPFLPLTCAAVTAVIVACASMPHYLFARRPFPLFLIAAGHDTVQLTAAIFTIYFLNW